MPTLVHRLIRACPILVLCLIVVPRSLMADDKSGNESAPNSSDSAKPRSTPEPTDRERLLLDRVELLEKRVAELEGKKQPAGERATIEPVSAAVPALTSESEHSHAQTPAKRAKAEPFAFADFTWLNGNARTKELAMDTKLFTPEIRADVDYVYDFNHPKDNTIVGSSEVFRAGEVQVTQLGVGGDFHYDNVRARIMTQFGLYSEATPRNDAGAGLFSFRIFVTSLLPNPHTSEKSPVRS